MSAWLVVNDTLRSEIMYSQSLFDIAGIKKVLGNVAKIDRLPERNTSEDPLSICDAWDHVDLYAKFAT